VTDGLIGSRTDFALRIFGARGNEGALKRIAWEQFDRAEKLQAELDQLKGVEKDQ
jgi:hypothetical protein